MSDSNKGFNTDLTNLAIGVLSDRDLLVGGSPIVTFSLKRPLARVPYYDIPNDVGLSLISSEEIMIPPLCALVVPTGVSIKINSKYIYGAIEPRPFLMEKGLILHTNVIVKPNEEVLLNPVIWNATKQLFTITPGVKIAWLVFHEFVRLGEKDFEVVNFTNESSQEKKEE